MKKRIEIEIDEYYSLEELTDIDRELVEKAMAATDLAYAPYSGFMVGAGVRLKSGKILTGNNRENAAFPSGSCAEDTVISYAGANYPNDPIVTLAISAKAGSIFTPYPVSPCGNCRQIIAEEEDRTKQTVRIILYGRDKIEIINGISGLLPLRFSSDKLKG